MKLEKQHVVLLGDSIFDNGSYVPGEPSVPEQVQRHLPHGWQVTLLAVDGDVTADVRGQLDGIPGDTSCLIISVGGNDALRQSDILEQPVDNVGAALVELSRLRKRFAQEYRHMLGAVLEKELPSLVCTIYDQPPFSDPFMRQIIESSLPIYNDVILLMAIEFGVSVLDLRCICTEPSDYSELSPIEPSAVGGDKISAAIARIVQASKLGTDGTRIFSR